MGILDKIFGDANQRYLKSVKPIIEKINSLEGGLLKLSDEELKIKTEDFKKRCDRVRHQGKCRCKSKNSL